MLRVGLVAALTTLTGCAVGPNFTRPRAPEVSRYTTGIEPSVTALADGHTQRFLHGSDLAADWWHLFGSSVVNASVASAISGNQSLSAARATLRQANSVMRAGYGAFFPQIDGQVGGVYQQATPLRFGENLPATDFALYTLAGTVSYTFDIWGGQRRQVESLAAQVEAQRFTLVGAHVMICGNVIDALVARASYREQIEAANATIALEREQLRITEAQASGGTIPFANVLAIKSQLASTEALVPQLAQKADQTDHLLATLMGRAPADITAPDLTLEDFTLPVDLPVTLPSKLVAQRPDILVAEAQLHSANALIGVATAAMLPNVTLSGGVGVNNTSLTNLFGPNGVFWSLGGGLTAPIFHGGTLFHQRKAAIAARDAALANYKQTVLAAFEQVADALRALEHDAETLKAQKEAADAAEQALHLMQANYASGIANYLQVIIANEQYLQARIGYVQAAAQRLEDTVALYVALGGGWWHAPTRSASLHETGGPRFEALAQDGQALALGT